MYGLTKSGTCNDRLESGPWAGPEGTEVKEPPGKGEPSMTEDSMERLPASCQKYITRNPYLNMYIRK